MDRVDAVGESTITRAQKLRPADGLEQAFLAEMLKYAGLGQPTENFSGGIGESQFTSMLSDAYAEVIAQRIDLRLNLATR